MPDGSVAFIAGPCKWNTREALIEAFEEHRALWAAFKGREDKVRMWEARIKWAKFATYGQWIQSSWGPQRGVGSLPWDVICVWPAPVDLMENV